MYLWCLPGFYWWIFTSCGWQDWSSMDFTYFAIQLGSGEHCSIPWAVNYSTSWVLFVAGDIVLLNRPLPSCCCYVLDGFLWYKKHPHDCQDPMLAGRMLHCDSCYSLNCQWLHACFSPKKSGEKEEKASWLWFIIEAPHQWHGVFMGIKGSGAAPTDLRGVDQWSGTLYNM